MKNKNKNNNKKTTTTMKQGVRINKKNFFSRYYNLAWKLVLISISYLFSLVCLDVRIMCEMLYKLFELVLGQRPINFFLFYGFYSWLDLFK